MLRSLHCPPGVYTPDGPSGGGHAPRGCSSPPVLRRLDLVSPITAGRYRRSARPVAAVRPAGATGQSRQVSSGAHSVHRLLGHDYSVGPSTGLSHSGQGGQFSAGAPHLHGLRPPTCQAMAVFTRAHGFPDPLGARLATAHAGAPTSAQPQVEQVRRRLHTDRVACFPPSRPPLVGEGETPPPGPGSSLDFSGFSPVLGRIYPGLGMLSPSTLGRRKVVSGGGWTPHQCVGTPSSRKLSHALPSTPQGPHRGDLCRQHHGISIPCSPRGYEVRGPEQGGSRDPTVGGGSSDFYQDPVPEWPPKRCSGRDESERSGPSHGMDATSGGVRNPLAIVGATISGPFRYRAEFPAPSFRVPVSGPNGDSVGCLPLRLEPPGTVRLSADSCGSQSAQQTSLSPGHLSHLDCSILAETGMVPRPPEMVDRRSTIAAATPGPSTTTALPPVSPRSPVASANRVETVQRFLRHRGYSRRVASFLAGAHRPSTLMNYQSKWKTFRKWCRREGHTSSTLSSQKVADFLLFLHQERRLSASAILGYKAVLNGIFSFRGFDLCSDKVVTAIVRACCRQVRRSGPKVPAWNVDVVLRALLTPPFEPMDTADLRHVTMKTLFLVALATAKRVGELQALSAVFARRGEDWVLSYLPEFVAKTETQLHPLPTEFLLQNLTAILGPDGEDRLLCPVRALRYYLRRTAGPSRPRHLFVSLKDRTHPMSKAAISFFIRQVIRSAHETFPDGLAGILRVKAHEVRAVATSLLWNVNRRLSDVMEAACWRTPSVFANHYLRTVQRVQEEVFSLGPIIAAGGVVP